MAKDPVCGMRVDEGRAKKKKLMIKKRGKSYYFCSKICKERFGKELPWYKSTKKLIPIALGVVLGGFALSAFVFGFMIQFMGWFFIVVSLLKVIDWKGFVMAFRMYDILAKKSSAYAWAYPVIELGIGVLFLTRLSVTAAAGITLIIMSIGTVGIAQNVFAKTQVRCACLGTRIPVPLTTFTLFEDVLMAVMAIVVLLG